MNTPKSILITGASSGIGKALAEYYAKPDVTLFLTGRNLARLEEVANICRSKGAEAFVEVAEIEDAKTLRMWVQGCDAKKPLDLVIANAGISSAGQDANEEFERKIFNVNLGGVLNTVYPVLDCMRPRKSGQIALISSLAAMYGMPYAPAYCSSKSAVKVYGESLRNSLKKHNIKVSVICPGFIATPLTDKNPYHMPLIMTAEKAAKTIATGLQKNRGLIAFPKRMYSVLWLLRLLPSRWSEKLTAKVNSEI